ncbi:MAG: sensor histidine kinase [Angustibacter sp.]
MPEQPSAAPDKRRARPGRWTIAALLVYPAALFWVAGPAGLFAGVLFAGVVLLFGPQPTLPRAVVFCALSGLGWTATFGLRYLGTGPIMVQDGTGDIVYYTADTAYGLSWLGVLAWLVPAVAVGFLAGRWLAPRWRLALVPAAALATSIWSVLPLPALAAVVGLLAGALWRSRRRERVMGDRIGELDRITEQLELRRAVQLERAALARELHDIVGHHVTAVVVLAEAAQARLGEDSPSEISRMADCARSALTELDTLVVGLREPREPSALAPAPELDDLGSLLAPLTDAGVTATLSVDLRREVPQAVQVTAYRIVQECVTNIIRHAAARLVRITVAQEGTDLVLTVTDDGRGFSPHATTDRRGLLGIRERVRLLSGQLDVASEPGQGTQVLVRLPIDPPSVPPTGSARTPSTTVSVPSPGPSALGGR